MCVLIYVDEITPRIEYVFHYLIVDILGVSIQFTDSVTDFKNSDLPKLNYSRNNISDGLFFLSSEILFEKTISYQNIDVATFKDVKVLFPCTESCLPFDIFAATFYLITRYEEYLVHQNDQHLALQKT